MKIAQKIFDIKPHHSARLDIENYRKTRKITENLSKIKRKNYDPQRVVLPPILHQRVKSQAANYSEERQKSDKKSREHSQEMNKGGQLIEVVNDNESDKQ